MRSRLLPLSLLLALGLAWGGVHAQVYPAEGDETTILPVLNKVNGKVEGYLVLEPADLTISGSTHNRFGAGAFGAAFGSADSLALLCNHKNGGMSAIGSLANNCMLANFGDSPFLGTAQRASATAAFGNRDGKIGVNAGNARENLPAWRTPGAVGPDSGKVEVNDLTVFARKSLPGEGYVTFAGTVAKARLLSPAAAAASGFDTDRWTSKSLSLGAGIGDFGANLVGHVVDMPGQPKWEGLGVGVTWRTPWSGQLSVGADNIITRGKNPFAPPSVSNGEDEGAIPYVRYEQDL